MAATTYVLVFSFCLGSVLSQTIPTTIPTRGYPIQGPTTLPPSSDVNIVATPSSIHEGFTKYLSINCTFSHHALSDFKTIMSLILSKTDGPKDSNFQEIATVTAFSSGVDVTNQVGAEVKGHLEANSQSFISYEWKYPTTAVEGQYRCEAYGMDRHGHPRDTQSTTTVVDKAVDMNMVLHNMKKMDMELDELLKFKLDMTSRLQMSLMAIAENSTVYNGKTYFLSRPMVKNTAVSASMCQLYGGQLLEVDNVAEYNFLTGFVQGVDEPIALGATDEAREGTWVSMSGNPIYLRWEPHHVNNGTDSNCLYLGNRGNGFGMFDDACYGLTFDRFICEI